MRFIKYLFLLLILILGWLIGWSNSVSVPFGFLNWASPNIPVFILYFLFLFLGVFIGIILGRFANRKR